MLLLLMLVLMLVLQLNLKLLTHDHSTATVKTLWSVPLTETWTDSSAGYRRGITLRVSMAGSTPDCRRHHVTDTKTW